MMNIAGVQFRKAGKIYDFMYDGLELLREDVVVVKTQDGAVMGSVAILSKRQPAQNQVLMPILRLATDEDFKRREKYQRKAQVAKDFCKRKISETGLPMKLVEVEYLLSGGKATFYFTADERVDFRQLVKDLVNRFRIRVELRQIGVRDEAKVVGGIGVCGRELCCSTWLRDFEPISVGMAKTQNLNSSPSKLAGQCGRLRCCLRYENQTYQELRKGLPSSCGSCAKTKVGTGKVIGLNILEQKFMLRLDDSEKVIELGPQDFIQELSSSHFDRNDSAEDFKKLEDLHSHEPAEQD
ncbi:MAG: stage 0 sporulation protein [Deltaproteobacteria bacterium]|nr:stage 0 sporulation protein [Deltaproteobacteria bacterium]